MNNDREKLIDAFEFYRLMRQITRQIEIYREKVAKLVGLSGAQLYILWNLFVDGSLSYSDLANKSGLAKNSLSTLAKSLVQLEMIQQVSDPSDGRITYLSLTEAGKQKMEQVVDLSLSMAPRGLNYMTDILDTNNNGKKLFFHLNPIIEKHWT